METAERFEKLTASYRTAMDQTFMGKFWPGYYDLYRKWGYDFYELNPYYESFAFRNFEGYTVMNNRRRRWSYDAFGDRITKMASSATIWREMYHPGGLLFRDIYPWYITTGIETQNTTGVTIASETTRDWSARFIHAGEMGVNFTPMTLKLSMIPAVRFDFWSPNNHLTALRSFMQEPYKFREGVLIGTRFIRKLGIVNLGTTYVNLHRIEQMVERGDVRKGCMIRRHYIPAIVAVKFADDSPGDGIGGATVQKVQIIVNGELRPDINPEVIRRDSENKQGALGRVRNGIFVPTTYYEWLITSYDRPKANKWRSMEIPYYADYIMKSLLAGEEEVRANPQQYNYSDSFIKSLGDGGSAMAAHLENEDKLSDRERKELLRAVNRYRLDKWFEMLDPNMPQEANGHDILVYYFDLDGFNDVRSVAIDCIVGNDYEISYSFISVDNTTGTLHNTPERLLKSSYWKTIKEAPGNVRNLSNLKHVTFDLGMPTAIEYMGFDIDTIIKGFKIRGEYVHGIQWMQYPDGKPWEEQPSAVEMPPGAEPAGIGGMGYSLTRGYLPQMGARHQINDKAYWLTFMKESQFWGIGGEIYYHGPQYETRLWVQNEGGYVENNTIYIPLVEDNDDNDKWPDQWSGGLNSGYMTILSMEDIDGVFPGLDEDHDGLPDTNRNGNQVPDYEEPFLRFYTDPPEYIYGDDFNNNQYPDYIEDDLESDVPYNRGESGQHFFIKLKPIETIALTVGRHDGGLVNGGGRNKDHYVKFSLSKSGRNIGSYFLEIKCERIQDNIPDYVYTFAPTKPEGGRWLGGMYGFGRQFYADWVDDEMMYRDSDVYRFYFQSMSRRYLGLSFINQIRFERNFQMGGYLYDQTYQEKDRVDLLTMVSRLDGLYRWGKWSFMPGLKVRILKRVRESLDIPLSHQRTIIPRTIFQYDISDRTNVKIGAEALPWLYFRHRDLVLTHVGRREKNYLFEVSNRSTYFGYTVYAFAGINIESVQFDSWLRKFENRETSSAYLRVILGW